MAFALLAANLIYRPFFIALFALLSLLLAGFFFVLIGQTLFWIFSDVSGFSLVDILGGGYARRFAELLALDPALIKRQFSHLVWIIVVVAIVVILFTLSVLNLAVQQFLALRVTVAYMRNALVKLKKGKVEEAHDWILHNLNSRKMVERTVGHVSGHAVTAYESENRIKGHFRRVLLNMHEALNNANVDEAVGIAEGWLKKPRL